MFDDCELGAAHSALEYYEHCQQKAPHTESEEEAEAETDAFEHCSFARTNSCTETKASQSTIEDESEGIGTFSCTEHIIDTVECVLADTKDAVGIESGERARKGKDTTATASASARSSTSSSSFSSSVCCSDCASLGHSHRKGRFDSEKQQAKELCALRCFNKHCAYDAICKEKWSHREDCACTSTYAEGGQKEVARAVG